MATQGKKRWDGVERRTPNSCRRIAERRTNQERRCDRRVTTEKQSRTLYGWLRSLIHSRLGVDRRKNRDQRVIANRRRITPNPLLTRAELDELLK